MIQKVASLILKHTRKEGQIFPPNKTHKFIDRKMSMFTLSSCSSVCRWLTILPSVLKTCLKVCLWLVYTDISVPCVTSMENVFMQFPQSQWIFFSVYDLLAEVTVCAFSSSVQFVHPCLDFCVLNVQISTCMITLLHPSKSLHMREYIAYHRSLAWRLSEKFTYRPNLCCSHQILNVNIFTNVDPDVYLLN